MSELLWLLVPGVLGLSATGYYLVRPRLQPRELPPPALPAEPALDAEGARRALADTLASMVGKVPADVLARYESIHRRMLELLPRMGQLEGTSEDLYILHRTAGDYLPTAARSYLGLARSGAAERPLADGRTPHQVLLDQLDVIETRLADFGDALDRNDIDRLLEHGRFLQARFGQPSPGLRLE